jgi:hypothetical protein
VDGGWKELGGGTACEENSHKKGVEKIIWNNLLQSTSKCKLYLNIWPHFYRTNIGGKGHHSKAVKIIKITYIYFYIPTPKLNHYSNLETGELWGFFGSCKIVWKIFQGAASNRPRHGSSSSQNIPALTGQLTCLWLFPFNEEHGGVVKKTVSAFEWPFGSIGWTVTLYLQENDRSWRIM